MVLLTAASARSEDQSRIVVLQPDDELFRAISLSLSPWNVETTRSDASPLALQPEAVEGVSHLASELGVEAVVWISSAERGSLLWVFDARSGDFAVRTLAEMPPFDSAQAAAVALSVKTLLRSSAVAPPAERLGAAPPAPAERLGAQPPAASKEPPRADAGFALELGAGGYWLAKRQAELMIQLAAVAWIPSARRLGGTLSLSLGPGFRIEDARYLGHYREFVVGGRMRYRLLHEPRMSASVSLGGALHFTTLEGTLVERSVESKVSRMNPSLDLETSLSVYVTRAMYLGASAGVAYSPTHRRYLVEGEPLFSPWPAAVGVSGYCGVELF
jgi:hypothetical protein